MKQVHVDMAEIEAMLKRAKQATAEVALRNDSDGAQARMGTAVHHAFTRHLAEEWNRGTDNEMLSHALAGVCANMICDLVGSTLPQGASLEEQFPFVETQLAKVAWFLSQRFQGRGRRMSSDQVYAQEGGRA